MFTIKAWIWKSWNFTRGRNFRLWIASWSNVTSQYEEICGVKLQYSTESNQCSLRSGENFECVERQLKILICRSKHSVEGSWLHKKVDLLTSQLIIKSISRPITVFMLMLKVLRDRVDVTRIHCSLYMIKYKQAFHGRIPNRWYL